MYRGWTQTDYQMWLQHVQRMDTNRLQKVATSCRVYEQNRQINVATTYKEDVQKKPTKCGYNIYSGWTQTHYQIWLQHVQRMDTKRLKIVTTTCTDYGQKQTTKSGHNIYRGWTKSDYEKWLQHVQSMEKNRLLKVATSCTECVHKQTNNSGYNM